MPLSDREIKELLEKAGRFRKVKGNDLPYLEQALNCYNQIIANTLAHPHYFSERAEAKYRLSSRLSRRDLLDSAIEDINRAIELDPDTGWRYRNRGYFLWEKSEGENILYKKNQLLTNVIANYKSCLSRQATDADTWLSLIAINIILYNWDEAISFYGQCKPYIDTKENRLFCSYLGCLALTFAGDTLGEETKPLHDQSIRLDNLLSRETFVSSFLGKIRTEEDYKEKWDNVIEIMKMFISHYSNYANRGILLRDLGLYEDALIAFDKAIELDPNYTIALNNKSSLLKKFGRYEEALEVVNTTIKLRPDHSGDWTDKGNLLWDLRRYEEALKAYDKATELNPSDFWPWRNKSKLLDNLERYNEAFDACEKAIKLWLYDIDMWKHKDHLLYRVQRYKDAVKAAERAIEIEPTYTTAWEYKGRWLKELKRYEEALDAFDQTIRVEPKYLVNVWYFKKECLHELKRHEEVINVFNRLLEIDREDRSFDDSTIWYNKGEYLWKELKRYEEAITAFEKSMELHPEDSGAPYCRAECLFESKRYYEALKAFDKIIEGSPEHPWAWYYRGKCLIELKNYKEACIAFDKAIESWPEHQARDEILSLKNSIVANI